MIKVHIENVNLLEFWIKTVEKTMLSNKLLTMAEETLINIKTSNWLEQKLTVINRILNKRLDKWPKCWAPSQQQQINPL